jgi:hypothetical protein
MILKMGGPMTLVSGTDTDRSQDGQIAVRYDKSQAA